MFKNILIIFACLFITACAEKIKYVGSNNYNYEIDKSTIKPEQYVSNSKHKVCALIFCTRYGNMELNDFILETIKKFNDNGIKGDYLTDIKVDKTTLYFLLFSYEAMQVSGAIVDKNNISENREKGKG